MLKYFIALLSLVLLSTQAKADNLDIFDRAAKETGVPVKLLRAICWAESKHDPEGYNHGDGVGTNHAFGMCQVLHSTARNFGFQDEKCKNDFQDKVTFKKGKRVVIKASRTEKDCKLFDPYTGVLYGALYLKDRLDMYKGDWIHASAAYNAGTLKYCKNGVVRRAKDNTILWKCTIGGILNQEYVDQVLEALKEER